MQGRVIGEPQIAAEPDEGGGHGGFPWIQAMSVGAAFRVEQVLDANSGMHN